MTRDHHYNAALHARLSVLVAQQDYAALTSYIDGLSNAHRRTAGYILGERIALALDAPQFWALFAALWQYDARAFLVTMLKSFVEGMAQQKFSISDAGFLQLCGMIRSSQIDVQKTLATLLPHLTNVQDIRSLFSTLHYTEMSQWIPFLVSSIHLSTAFVLLQALHYVEHDRAYLIRIAHLLMRRGDSLSFNMAGLIKSVYGLDELKGACSLRLQPYELSRIENSFEAFCQVMARR